jgi:shikimate dehydrogenase
MLLSEFLQSKYASSPFAAVLGYPVTHSRSPGIHNASLAYHGIPVRYHALECPVSELDLLHRLFMCPEFRGANVTIPLKEKIVDLMDELDDTALKIGAINTVVRNPNSLRLKGFNTDAYGFMKPLESYGTVRSAAILGVGGAARAIVHALLEQDCNHVTLVSRRPEKTDLVSAHPKIIRQLGYDQLDEAIRKSDLIVNTTPVGMHPDTGNSPVPVSMLPLFKGKVCYDIIYNPPVTRLLEEVKRHGARTIGGLDMFLYQAARSFELWFGKAMPLSLVRSVVLKSLKENGATA